MSKAQLQFETEDRSGVHLVRISGPLDSITYDQFRAYMDPLVIQSQKRVVLDCTDLTYVNSRGVALLLHYQRTSSLKLSFFGITGVPPRIVKEVEMLGLRKLLSWYPTLDSAMEIAAAM